MTGSKQEAIMYRWFWILIAFLMENCGILCAFIHGSNWPQSWGLLGICCLMCYKGCCVVKWRVTCMRTPSWWAGEDQTVQRPMPPLGKEVTGVATRAGLEGEYEGSGLEKFHVCHLIWEWGQSGRTRQSKPSQVRGQIYNQKTQRGFWIRHWLWMMLGWPELILLRNCPTACGDSQSLRWSLGRQRTGFLNRWELIKVVFREWSNFTQISLQKYWYQE